MRPLLAGRPVHRCAWRGRQTSSGEANLWPFWNGVVEDPGGVMATAFDPRCGAIGYTDPYPLRYETRRRPEDRGVAHAPHPSRLPGQHGLDEPRVDVPAAPAGGVVPTPDATVQTVRYVEWIERDGTFWEVLDLMRKELLDQPEGEDHDRRGGDLWSAISLDALENRASGAGDPIARPPPSSP